MTSEQSPYPYRSDLFHLWAWAKRIDDYLTTHETPGHLWPMVFRDDRDASDAMMRLGIEHAEPVRQIREHLSFTEAMFGRWTTDPSDANAENVFSAVGDLSKRIGSALSVIDAPAAVVNADPKTMATGMIADAARRRDMTLTVRSIAERTGLKPSTVGRLSAWKTYAGLKKAPDAGRASRYRQAPEKDDDEDW